MDPKLAAIVRQHAETARLLGVDFVPSFRAAVAAPAPIHAPAEPAPKPSVPVTRSEPRPEPSPVQPTFVLKNDPPPQASMFAPAVAPAGGEATPVRSERATRDPAATNLELEALRAHYEKEAPHAPYIRKFTKIVFGEGDPCARLMFIGEAPGEDEDLSGRPFVGRAGQLLEKQIAAMGLRRDEVYIANVLKVRPPENRTPTIEEAEASAPFLFEQIRIVAPEAIVTLGLPATRLILRSDQAMGRLRSIWGTFRDPAGRVVPVMPTYHPAYLLRSYTSENRAKVWEDLQKVMAFLGLSLPPARRAESDANS
jgi:uracil-DNA glycosylase family 4